MNKNIFLIVALLTCYSAAYGQFYNDGALVTIQPDALVHIQGNFTNQGGEITNSGTIEVGGDWINTVMTPPLTPGSGLVTFLGDTQFVGGDFPTLFNDVNLENDAMVTLTSNVGILNDIQLGSSFIQLNESVLHLLNSDPSALNTEDGGVVAETSDAYGYVRWDIGQVSNGLYTIPFFNSESTMIPMQYSVDNAGAGEEGYLLFSTFGTDESNSPLPIDVDNITIGSDSDGVSVVDRFWILEAQDYTTEPGGSLSLTYDDPNEVSGSNIIATDALSMISYETGAWSTLGEGVNAGNSVTTGVGSTFGEFALSSNQLTDGVVAFGFDECSLNVPGYEEYQPTFPNQLSCVESLDASVYRNNAGSNGHSCTAGLAGTTTMCISSFESCTPDFESSRVLFFDTEYAISDGGSVSLESVDFSHLAAETFAFSNGATGINNYATLWGYRVLDNGVVITENTDIATAQEWAEFSIGLSGFALEGNGTLSVQFLPYCTVGNGSPVSAWDIENLTLMASCDEERMYVFGEIKDRNDHLMADISINVTEQPTYTTSIATSDGVYDYVSDAELIILEPTHDVEILNGVSTLDILMIQLHLLNIQSFVTDYDYIAADVNNSRSVTAQDMVDLRNVILQRTDVFPNNTSWRFHFEDGTTNQNSTYSINEQFASNIEGSHEVNFTGIKVGDINNSVVTTRSAEDVEMKYTVVNNQIALYFEEDVEVMGLQLSLNVIGAQIASLSADLDQFNTANSEVNDGTVDISWNTTTCKSITAYEQFIVITLDEIASPTVSVDIAEDGNYSEYYDCSLSTIGINLNNDVDTQTASDALFISVSPNPVANILYVKIDKQTTENVVSVELLDLEGKTILANGEIDLSKGINLTALHPGFYLLKVTNGIATQYEKILKL